MSLRGEKRTEFPQSVRKKVFARACLRCDVEGVENIPGRPQCENCGKEVRSGGFIFEHVDPDGLGGEPTFENCKLHCKPCADFKTHTEDNPRMRKADAVLKSAYDLRPAKRQQIQSQGFRRSERQRRASSPVNKWRGF
jgi:HNH endonuclease